MKRVDPGKATEVSLPASAASKATTLTACIIGFGGFAEWLIAFSMNTLIMPVFTTGFGLSASLVGWAITLPRLVDALTDPLIGHISDRTRSRWGRRRPYIFGGGLMSGAFFILLWQASPAWSQTALFAWLLVLSVVLWNSYSCLAIPLNALIYEVTDDYHERTRISAITTFFKILPQLLSGWIYWLALRPFFGGEIPGMRWVSVGIGVLIAGAACLPAFFVRERFAHRVTKQVSLRDGLAQAFACRPFLHLLSTRVLITLGNYIFTGMLFYLMAYYVCRGDKVFATQLLGYYATLQTVLAIGVLPVVPRLAQIFGKRTLLLLGTGGHMVTALVAWFFLTPDQPWLLMGIALIFAPAGVFMGVFTGAALPDICDVDELEHGTRREGLFSSVTAFVTKIEISLCALVVGYLLSFASFDSTAVIQTLGTMERLRVYAIAPYALLGAVAFLIAFKYPLTTATMHAVRTKLAANRARSTEAGDLA